MFKLGEAGKVLLSSMIVTFLLLFLITNFIDLTGYVQARVAVDTAGRAVLKCVVPTEGKGADGEPCLTAKAPSPAGRLWDWLFYPTYMPEWREAEYAAYRGKITKEQWQASYQLNQVQSYSIPPVSRDVSRVNVRKYEEIPSKELRYVSRQFSVSRKGTLIPTYLPESLMGQERTKELSTKYKDNPEAYLDLDKGDSLFPSFDKSGQSSTVDDWHKTHKEFVKLDAQTESIVAGRYGKFQFSIPMYKVLNEKTILSKSDIKSSDLTCKSGYNCDPTSLAGGSGEPDQLKKAYLAFQVFVKVTSKNNRSPAKPAKVRIGRADRDSSISEKAGIWLIRSRNDQVCLGGIGWAEFESSRTFNSWLRGPAGASGGGYVPSVCRYPETNPQGDVVHQALQVDRNGNVTVEVNVEAYAAYDDVKAEVVLLYYYDHYRALSPVSETVVTCPEQQLTASNSTAECPKENELDDLVESCAPGLKGGEFTLNSCNVNQFPKRQQVTCNTSTPNSFPRSDVGAPETKYLASCKNAPSAPALNDQKSCGWKDPAGVLTGDFFFASAMPQSCPVDSVTRTECTAKTAYCSPDFGNPKDVCAWVKNDLSPGEQFFAARSNTDGSTVNNAIFDNPYMRATDKDFHFELTAGEKKYVFNPTSEQASCAAPQTPVVVQLGAPQYARAEANWKPDLSAFNLSIPTNVLDATPEIFRSNVTIEPVPGSRVVEDVLDIYPFLNKPVMRIGLQLPTVDSDGKLNCHTFEQDQAPLDQRLRYYASAKYPEVLDPSIKFEAEETLLNMEPVVIRQLHMPGKSCSDDQWEELVAPDHQCIMQNIGTDPSKAGNCKKSQYLGRFKEELFPNGPEICQKIPQNCRKEYVGTEYVAAAAAAPEYDLFEDALKATAESSAKRILGENIKSNCAEPRCLNVNVQKSDNGDVNASVTYNFPLNFPLKEIWKRDYVPVEFSKTEALELSLTGTKPLK
jgi:hypothetical protein